MRILISLTTLLFYLQFFSLPAKAQTQQAKQIELSENDQLSGKAFFVAEIHGFYELDDFKFALIQNLQNTCHIKHVVLEVGSTMAYHINYYMQTGDWSYFALYNNSPKARAYMDRWKQLYLAHPFTVHGIDFERMEFVSATKLILDKNEQAKTSLLYKYVCSIIDTAARINHSKNGYEARTALYDKAKNIFEKEKDNLRQTVKTDYTALEDIFENPASEENMKGRNKAMYANMQKLKNIRTEGFVCILGAAHNLPHSSQSLLSRYLNDNSDSICLIKMLCKNCYTSTYTVTNYYEPFVSDLEAKKRETEDLETNFDRSYKQTAFPLIREDKYKNIPLHTDRILVYYALFRDQPKL